MNASPRQLRHSSWRTLAAIFVVAVGFNYVWELVQSPLYVGMEDFSRMLWHCFVAALGDGVLVLLLFAVGWLALHRRDWFVRPGMRGYTLLFAAGLVIALGVEWVAIRVAKQWAYTKQMPLIPGLEIGLTAVAQMLILPPFIFRVVAAWLGRDAVNNSISSLKG